MAIETISDLKKAIADGGVMVTWGHLQHMMQFAGAAPSTDGSAVKLVFRCDCGIPPLEIILSSRHADTLADVTYQAIAQCSDIAEQPNPTVPGVFHA
jgi:hypothetical protein